MKNPIKGTLALAFIALGFVWRPAWGLLAVLVLMEWAERGWEQLLDAIRGAARSQGKPERVVKAEEFILVDAKGIPRARLAIEDGIKPMLALLDEDGARANYFMLTPTGPVLRLGNRGGEEIMLVVGDYVGGPRTGTMRIR
jgi:hypothetical protein